MLDDYLLKVVEQKRYSVVFIKFRIWSVPL